MKGLENNTYLVAYLISNVAAILFLLITYRSPRAGKIIFSILFAWAAWVNWRTAINSPQFYLYYSYPAMPLYEEFIQGWFSRHITLVVTIIAVSQAFIAAGLLLRGWVYKTAVLGGIVFLLAIMPLGAGSAFPCSLIMAITFVLFLYKQDKDYIWGQATGMKLGTTVER
jgi:hypothetical protein